MTVASSAWKLSVTMQALAELVTALLCTSTHRSNLAVKAM